MTRTEVSFRVSSQLADLRSFSGESAQASADRGQNVAVAADSLESFVDLVYLQRDRSFCTGKTVSSPRLQVFPFVLRPYCKAAGLPLQIEPKPGGKTNPKTSIMSHVALETLNINMQ